MAISDQVKKAVFERDGYKCRYCGKALTENDAQLDHIMPRSEGGSDDIDNLALSCKTCNITKSNKKLDYFLEMKEKEERAKRTWSWVSLSMAVIGLLASSIIFILVPSNKNENLEKDIKLKQLQDVVALQGKEIQELRLIVNNQHKNDKNYTDAKAAAKFEVLEKHLNDIDSSLNNNPTKALSIIILNKDFEHLKANLTKDVTDLDSKIKKIYDLALWLVGILVTVFLSVIGYAVTILLQVKSRGK